MSYSRTSFIQQLKDLRQPAPAFDDEFENEGVPKLVDKALIDGEDALINVFPERTSRSLKSSINYQLSDEDPRYFGQVAHRRDLFEDNDEEDDGGQDSMHSKISVISEEAVSSAGSDSAEADDDKPNVDSEDELDKQLTDSAVHASSVQQFSDAQTDAERGSAVQAQLRMWDDLMSLRIKLQKIMSLVNILPKDDTSWSSLIENSDGDLETLLRQCRRQTWDMQSALLAMYDAAPAVLDTLLSGESKIEGASSENGDEEIVSSDSEMDEDGGEPRRSLKPARRKLDCISDAEVALAKGHSELQDFQNRTLLKWHDKTKFARGKAGRNFNAFEQNVLKQIEMILSDEARLIRRTQLVRSDDATYELTQEGLDSSQPDAPKINSDPLFDERIFDDNDFYQQQLRELIERKTAGDASGSVTLGRQWLEIQKLRSKLKRKVDTKRTKGRKLRYDVQQKLVSFMPRIDNCSWSETARDDLFASLFRHVAQPTDKFTSASSTYLV